MEDIVRESYGPACERRFHPGLDDSPPAGAPASVHSQAITSFGRSTAGRLLHLRKRSRFTPASPYERSLRHLGA